MGLQRQKNSSSGFGFGFESGIPSSKVLGLSLISVGALGLRLIKVFSFGFEFANSSSKCWFRFDRSSSFGFEVWEKLEFWVSERVRIGGGANQLIVRSMGALDFFENLKGGKGAVDPVEAAEPAAPSAPPASDLEAPLLQQNGDQNGASLNDPNQDITEQRQLPPVLLGAPPPDNDPLLYVCRVLSAVTAVGTLLCMVVNAISLFRSFDYRGFDYRVSVFVGILRSYSIAIAVLVILAETEWELLFRFWGVLEFWVGRGLFQILVASLTRVLRRASGETPAESLLHEIASWWLFACGIVYSVAGLLCLGRIKRSHLNKQTRYLRAKRDLEELHRRRADLEGQLSRHHE